jgi:phosphoglycolate phosphatase
MVEHLAGNFQAVIFDLDGTLVDSAADLREALNKTLADCGRVRLSLPSVIGMIGNGVAKLVERGFAATGAVPPAEELAEQVAVFNGHYDHGLLVHSDLYPGVPAMLKALRQDNRRLGICTNKSHDQSLAILSGLNIGENFDTVTGGDTTDRRKPDPKPLLRTIEAMETTPAATIFVGDSMTDVETAKRSRCISILVTHGYAHGDPKTMGATRVIEDLSLIPQAVRALENP